MIEPGILDARRVLVLAPHPDDETLACGGTIALLVAAGAEVQVAFVSDGAAIERQVSEPALDVAAVRKRESEEAALLLGVHELRFLGYPDGALSQHGSRIQEDIGQLVAAFRPAVILAPSPLDHHDDHIAVSHASITCALQAPAVKLALYQVYGTMRFNELVDIGAVIARKDEALRRYPRSLCGDPEPFVHAARGIARFFSSYSLRAGYYEAFLVLPRAPQLAELDIVDWLTYGQKTDPAGAFLTRLRAVDELLFELRRCEGTVVAKEEEVERLRADIALKTKELEAAARDLAAIKARRLWRIERTLGALADRFLPAGSSVRRIHDRLRGRRWLGGWR